MRHRDRVCLYDEVEYRFHRHHSGIKPEALLEMHRMYLKESSILAHLRSVPAPKRIESESFVTGLDLN